MLISLKEIANTLDKIESYRVPLELESLDFQGDFYGVSKKGMVDITVINDGRKMVSIEADAKVTLSLYCERCLKQLEYDLDISMTREVDFNINQEDRIMQLDHLDYISEYNLDVDKLIHEEVVINFPMKVLCDNQCKGLCKQCGNDLNLNPCDCDTREYDPRMLAIRDIFNDSKEV